MGIQKESLVRLGGKSTPRTKPLAIFEQDTNFKLTKSAWKVIERLKLELGRLEKRLQKAFALYRSASVQKYDLMQYLEFPLEDPSFYAALTVPEVSDDMTVVGKNGKFLNRLYLLDRWIHGQDADF